MNITLRVSLHLLRVLILAALSAGLFLALPNTQPVNAGNTITVPIGHQPLAVGWSIFGGYGADQKCEPDTTTPQFDHEVAWMTNGGTSLTGTVLLPQPTIPGGPFDFSCLHLSGASDSATLNVSPCPGTQVWDGSKCATPTTPSTPTNLTATPDASCGTGIINVSWSAVTGATSYRLRDGVTPIYTGAATSFQHSGLAAGSSHSYSVQAINSAGTSTFSGTVSANAPAACPGTNLTAGPISLNSGTLTKGSSVTFAGSVLNTGTLGVGSFTDQFKYGWSGIASTILTTLPQAPLAAGQNRPDLSSSLDLNQTGTLTVEYCVDTTNAITGETLETVDDNCKYASFTVLPGSTECSNNVDDDGNGDTDYPDDTAGCTGYNDDDESNSGGSCTGTVPANASLCEDDDQGLSGNVARTLTFSCIPNNAQKCEYVCDSTWTFSGSKCIRGSITANPSSVTSGTRTTVTWSSENTSFCTITSSQPTAISGSWNGTSGSELSNPLTTTPSTVFSLYCDNVLVAQAVVSVGNPGPPDLNVTPRVVPPNTPVTLTWDTNNTNEALCTLTGGGLSPNPLDPSNTDVPSGDPEQGTQNVTVTRTTTFTLTCPTGSDSVTVTVIGSGFET